MTGINKKENKNNKVVDAYPLSNMQAGMYFHYMLAEASAVYHDVFHFKLKCQWHVTEFENAIATVLAHHPILRTAFDFQKFSEPMQLVHAKGVVRFEYSAVNIQNEHQLQACIADKISELQARPFDLAQPSQIRFTVLQGVDGCIELLIDAHHMILDGWSMAVVLTELFQNYLANIGLISAGQVAPPVTKNLFKEFVKVERQILLNQAALDYWQTQLKPLDYHALKLGQSKADKNNIVRCLKFDIDRTQVEQLKQLAVKCKVDIRTLLLAAHLRLIAFVSGQPKATSLVVSNSRLEQLGGDKAVGLFVNSLPASSDLADMSWTALIEKLSQQQAQHMPYRAFPIAEMVKTQGHPISNVLFNFVHFHVYELIQGIDGFQVLDAQIDEKTNADLAVTFIQGLSGSLSVMLQYNTAMVAESSAQQLPEFYRNALQSMCLKPDDRCLQHSLMSKQQVQAVINNSYSLAHTPLRHETIHSLIENAAQQYASDTALTFEGQQLSYQTFNEKANQLAHLIRQQGIGAGDIVCLCIQRSFEQFIAVLAILKAGAAYLPLDTSFPLGRMQTIVKDANPQLIITQQQFANICPAATHSLLIDEENCQNAILSQPVGQMAADVRDAQASDPVFCLYTSGTTGKPKGVLMSHQAMSNLLFAQTEHNPLLRERMRTLQFASIGFDASFHEMISTLIWGGTLCLISEQARKDIHQLPELIQQQKIERLFMPFAALKVLSVSALQAGYLNWPIKLIVTAGEQLQMTDELCGWLKQMPHAVLDNHYGPTETHVVTAYRLDENPLNWPFYPPIGKPLANCQCWVLDQNRNLLPDGVQGELYVSGACLASGYLNNPEQSAEKFIEHSFDGETMLRLYRTGDLVSRLDDGNLMFLGRADEQVKVRGYRVELAEVEYQLDQLPSVASALVLPQKDSLGLNQLVAYVVLEAAQVLRLPPTKPTSTPISSPTTMTADKASKDKWAAQIKSQLQNNLPDYMLPSAIQILDKWPLTANGKVDRRALPKIETITSQNEYLPAKNEIEAELINIWAKLLAMPSDKISTLDNFFELGGHSLLVVRLVANIQKVLNRAVKLKDIYQYPSIVALANFLQNAEQKQYPAIAALERTQDAYPLSFAQQRLWFIDRMQGGSANYNMPAQITVEGHFNLTLAQQALAQIVERHQVLRTVYRDGENGPLQQVLKDVDVQIRRIDFSALEKTERANKIAELTQMDAEKPFDLSQDIMLRASYIQCAKQAGVLLFNMHHIASDGWSIAIFAREFVHIYQALKSGEAHGLTRLPIQYIDYAVWQKNHLTGAAFDAQLSYWQKQLSDVPTVHSLPLDFPRPLEQSGTAQMHKCTLPAGLADRIADFCRLQGLTPFMFYHGVLSFFIARYSYQKQVVIGTVVANRRQAELESLIGFFINTLVLRTDIDSKQTVGRYFAAIKETNLQAQEHQDIPFEQLIEHLNIPRSTQHAPLCQILLSMNNNETVDLTLDDVKFTTQISTSQASKFDLEIEVDETNEQTQLQWLYDCNLFAPRSIAQMAEHYVNLLEKMLDAKRCLADIGLLTASEFAHLQQAHLAARSIKSSVLNQGNTDKQDADFVNTQLMHSAFEAQVKRTPNATAIVSGTAQAPQIYSYQQLNQQANQLARFLLQQLAKPQSNHTNRETPSIAIICQRNYTTVVSILAVLKAGAAYIPLDANTPVERINHIVQDAAATIILGTQEVSENSIQSTDVSCIDATQLNQYKHFNRQNLTPDEVLISAEDLAYIIYTSGSSGTPKGVMVEHASIHQHLINWSQDLAITPADRFVLFSSLSFDASIEQLFTPFTLGASCYLLADNQQTPDALLSIIQSLKITVLDIPPAYWSEFIQTVDAADTADCLLHTLILGGERFPTHSLLQIEDKFPTLEQIINAYGPTESCITALRYKITRAEFSQITSMPIGQTFDDSLAGVLDADNNPLPDGAVGELYLAGPRLARGYLNNPQQSAQVFFEHPRLGVRIYKTGDKVRRLNNAQYVFDGRIDEQVKIRGFRVELAEIEQQISRLAQVSDTKVIVSETQKGQLKAFVKLNAPSDEEQAEAVFKSIRQQLKSTLPNYMLPNAYCLVDEWPMTLGGKLDTKQLDARASISFNQAYQAATSETEKTLVRLFENLLQVEKVGVNDSFFDLGGHSILAVRLVNQIKQTLGKQISLKALLDYPKVQDIAALIEKSDAAQASLPVITHNAQRRYQPFPLTGIQQSYFIGRKDDFALGNVGAYGYSEITAQQLDVERVQQAWNRLVERHDMLRMVVDENGEQVILPKVPEYQVAYFDFSALPDTVKKQRVLALREKMSHQVFSGMQWPLFDLKVSRLADNDFILHIGTDALAMDASSTMIIEQEFYTVYHQPDTRLPDLTLTFSDYVHALKALESQDVYLAAKAYWCQRVADFPFAPTLPLAQDPSQIKVPEFERRDFVLPKTQWQAVQHQAKQYQVTATALVLGVFAKVIESWSDNKHFALNLTLFNRLPVHPQVEKIVGDFTTLTLLEFNSQQGNFDFVHYLKNTQQQLWRDLEHSLFDGTQLLTELMRHHSGVISYPIVFTSTLGLQSSDDIQRFTPSQQHLMGETTYSISQTSQVWLDCQVSEEQGELRLVWDSVVDLFPHGMLDDMFAVFTSTLQTMSKQGLQASHLDLPQWQQNLVRTVNQTDSDLPQGLLHQPFLNAAKKFANKTAIRCQQGCLTYAQLEQESAKLAQQLRLQLRQQGACANTLIAVVMDKGWQQIVAVLAILRSGAAYLPIDAHLPASRIALLLKSGEVQQVVTTREHTNQIPEQLIIQVLADEIPAADTHTGTDRVIEFDDYHNQASDLAYVIFTSGSTGMPKGVMTDHAGARNTIEDINQRFEVSEKDSVFALSNLNFDLSVYDIFGVLGAGGCLVLPSSDEYRDPTAWLDYLQQQPQVTLWNTVPALMQMLVEHLESKTQNRPSLALRIIMMSGDWIPLDLPERIQKISPASQVHSLGGATEASIWSIHYPIVAPTAPTSVVTESTSQTNTSNLALSSVPYGKALANQQFYVLQQDLSLSPVWAAGDLYIAGVGLAKGYWRDEQKTAASFIDDPVRNIKLYKTGDRGRLLPDGNIEFLGREDFQVKIQGFRIELGEIETNLKRHQLLKEVFINTFETGGQKQLVAYYTQSNPSSAELDTSSEVEQLAQLLEFKKSNRAIRDNFDMRARVIDLPTVDKVIPLKTNSSLTTKTFNSVASIAFSELNQILAVCRRVACETSINAKALYPSAGSTYAVQLYLYLPESAGIKDAQGQLLTGCYYYHPLKHQLIKLSQHRLPLQHVSLFLLGDEEAIVPVYGQNSELFLQVEAGYIHNLMQTCLAPELMLCGLQNVAELSSEIPQAMALSAKHQLISVLQIQSKQQAQQKAQQQAQQPINPAHHHTTECTDANSDNSNNSENCNKGQGLSDIRLLPQGCIQRVDNITHWQRKSYRQYLPQALSLAQLNNLLLSAKQAATEIDSSTELYLKVDKTITSAELTLPIGIYHYQWQTHALHLCWQTPVGNLYSGENARIADGAALNFIFVAKQNENALAAGFISQAMTLAGLAKQVGVCAMGQLNHSLLVAALPQISDKKVVHSLTVGAINAQMFNQQKPTEPAALEQQLADFLALSLPDYMVPKHFIELPALPLTANGKIDRKALPLPQTEQAQSDRLAEQQGNSKLLSDIWSQVLALESVYQQDNFFQKGGNSLLAVRLVAQIKEQMLVDLPIGKIFEAPVFADMLNTVEMAIAEATLLRQVTAAQPSAKAASDAEQNRLKQQPAGQQSESQSEQQSEQQKAAEQTEDKTEEQEQNQGTTLWI
ncbi:amino acid adenylation domain-containing protein [Catenovulum sediminis]|uniref:Amino acid adenylation domain-containing protein n=1 Tax=Catenovulum sediminis TaxID=1740262 RepID=A0ABV1RMX1_9ALTE